MWWRRTRTTELDATRRRMIVETEIGLLIGLRFPERTPRIPTIQVGSGSFDPRFARTFWEEALGDLSGIEHLAAREALIPRSEDVPLYDPSVAHRR